MIIEKIKDKLREEQEPFKDRIKNNIIGVSDLVHCSHKYALLRQNPELTFNGLQYNNVVRGTLWHKAIETVLADLSCYVEVPLKYQYGQYTIMGNIDAVCDNVLVEIKTTEHLVQKPYQYWTAQLQLYMLLYSNFGEDDDIKGIILNVANEGFKEFEVEMPKLTEEEFKQFVQEFINDRKIIRECDYCFVNNVCDKKSSITKFF